MALCSFVCSDTFVIFLYNNIVFFKDPLALYNDVQWSGVERSSSNFKVWAFSFSSRRHSRLSWVNKYLAIDSGRHVSE